MCCARGYCRLGAKAANRAGGRLAGRIQKNRPDGAAFTLIELLVVISIITLLMALLVPTLQRVRNQARAVACQSKLGQWGVIFSMYGNDTGGRLAEGPFGAPCHLWPDTLRSYYADSNDLMFCPMAKRIKIRPSGLPLWGMFTLGIAGGKSTAWEYRYDYGHGRGKGHFSGSYGTNATGRIDDPRKRGSENNRPLMLDCAYVASFVPVLKGPPEYEDQLDEPQGIQYYCINRHDGAINALFLDFSVRKIGLKELWTLPWHARRDVRYMVYNRWTRTGGVLPQDWPPWMRNFKDY